MLLGACQAHPHCSISLLSASVSLPVTRGWDLAVAAQGGHSSLHKTNGLCGGLTLLWRETRKLLQEKAKTRYLVTHCTSQPRKERNLLLGSWEAAQGLGILSVQRCPGQLEMLSSWACQCPGPAAQRVCGLLLGTPLSMLGH